MKIGSNWLTDYNSDAILTDCYVKLNLVATLPFISVTGKTTIANQHQTTNTTINLFLTKLN